MTGGGTFANVDVAADVVLRWLTATGSRGATVAAMGNARATVGRATPEAREAGVARRLAGDR